MCTHASSAVPSHMGVRSGVATIAETYLLHSLWKSSSVILPSPGRLSYLVTRLRLVRLIKWIVFESVVPLCWTTNFTELLEPFTNSSKSRPPSLPLSVLPRSRTYVEDRDGERQAAERSTGSSTGVQAGELGVDSERKSVGEEVDGVAWDGVWRGWICARWMEGTSEDYAELLLTCVRSQSTQDTPSHSHPPTPSPPSTTIHDLPLEIIGRIIIIAYPAPSASLSERRERYRFLKATSLVCREWTPFAQEELWFDVELFENTVESFLEGGAGRHATHWLRVECWWREKSVQAVLRDVRGVRDLELYNCPISIDWLCGDNFKGRRMRAFPVDADF
jgi:hypothetical protein